MKPLPRPRRLTLTTVEIRAGYRRAADVPRLKYLARAMDARTDYVTIPVIKRALKLAEEDGVALDPMTGYVLADQSGAPAPKRKRKAPKKKAPKKKAEKAPETPSEPSEPAPDADATDDAPSPDSPEDAQESPTEG